MHEARVFKGITVLFHSIFITFCDIGNFREYMMELFLKQSPVTSVCDCFEIAQEIMRQALLILIATTDFCADSSITWACQLCITEANHKLTIFKPVQCVSIISTLQVRDGGNKA